MKIILLFILFFFGCNDGTYFYEDNGFLYFKDGNDDLYLVEGTHKIKVEDYKKPKFTERMELVDYLTINNLNIKFQCNLRYMNDVMHYRVKLSDIDNKNLNETMYFDKLKNRDKWFEVSLITDDLFTLDSIQLYSDDKVKIVSGDNLQAYQFEGKHRLNMNDFKLINKIKVSHFLGN